MIVAPSGRALTTLVLIFVVSIWSGAFPTIKLALKVVTPLELVLLRHLPGAIIFGLFLVLRRRRQVVLLAKRDGGRLVAMGLLAVVGYHFFLNWGETRIPAGTSALIIATNPVFTFIIAALFIGEKLNKSRSVGLAVAFIGLYISVRYGAGQAVSIDYWQGIAITVVAPLIWAIYTTLNRGLAGRHGVIVVAGAILIVGTLPMLLLINGPFLQRLYDAPMSFWLVIGFLSLINTALTTVLWTWALSIMDATRVSAFVYLVPVEALVWSWLFLSEPMTLWLLAGTAVLLVGVWVVQQGRIAWPRRKITASR